jgi:hypothetical protein
MPAFCTRKPTRGTLRLTEPTWLSFVLTGIFRDLLFALMKSLHYRRSPWYQHSLICKVLRKGSVILLHHVENSFLGELSMVLGK